jgi:predicted dienelactone hydrolase
MSRKLMGGSGVISLSLFMLFLGSIAPIELLLSTSVALAQSGEHSTNSANANADNAADTDHAANTSRAVNADHAVNTDHAGNASAATSKKSNVVYQDWSDSKRHRTLPVKIYLPETGKGPYPTVVFSHGLGGSREAATYLGDYLVRHGYLCIFVQHPGSDSAIWKPYMTQGRQAILEHMKSSASPQNLIDRAGDISFVIDELVRRNRDDEVLGKKVDLNEIACSGHSFGAGTTLAIAGEMYLLGSLADRRIKAAMYLCPPVNVARLVKGKTFVSIAIPGLVLTGTEDNSPIGNTTAADRRIPYDEIKAPHQYLVNFDGANHETFGGGRAYLDTPKTAKFHEMICKVAGEFLDATLRNDAKAWHWLDSSEATDYFGKSAMYERK